MLGKDDKLDETQASRPTSIFVTTLSSGVEKWKYIFHSIFRMFFAVVYLFPFQLERSLVEED